MIDIINNIFHERSENVRQTILRYLEILFLHHKNNNIISSSDSDYFIKREIYDCFQLSNFIRGNEFTDVGTGGGIPGILISILHPDSKLILVDRKQSYIDFLTYVVADLKLDNVEIIKIDVLEAKDKLKTSNLLIKNFSNKKISRMEYSKKFNYLMKTLFFNKAVSKVYMLTGSPVLKLDNSMVKGFSLKTKEISSPYFDTNRVIAEVGVENFVNS